MLKERLRDLDLNLMVVFEALLRCENVSRAAEELDMSQSTVSHALKRLRALFEDALFVRARDRMAPTPKAVELSGAIFEIMRLARSALLPSPSFDPLTSQRVLTLALGDVGDMVILPPLMRHLRQHNPGGRVISLPTTSEESLELLESGSLDIYVGIMDPTSPEILCQKLYEDRIVFLASATSPLEGEVGREEYMAMDHIALQSRSSAKSGQFIADALLPENAGERVRIETPHIAAIPAIVEEDDNLVAAIPISLARYFRRIAEVKILTPSFPVPTIAISQYWHRRFDKDPFNVWHRQSLYRLLKGGVNFGDEVRAELAF